MDLFPDKILPIQLIPDNNIPKLHLITGKRTCLIGEDILHLPEFLINTDGMTLHAPLIQPTVHLLIPLHKPPLKDLNKLQRYNQANGNKGIIQNIIRPQGYDRQFQTRHAIAVPDQELKGNVLKASQVAVYGASDSAQYFKGEHGDYYLVYHCLDVAGFCVRGAAVHHDGSLAAAVAGEADYPLRVLYAAASVQHVFLVY